MFVLSVMKIHILISKLLGGMHGYDTVSLPNEMKNVS
jgi:hypothetical protein